MRAAADFCRTHVHRTRTGDRASDLKEIRGRLGSRQCRSGLSDLGPSGNPACPAARGNGFGLPHQIGSGLVGVLYILDEPSIGLHQRDNRRLLQTLLRLRDLGNTVIVVVARCGDHAGGRLHSRSRPGAGTHGGKIIACTPKPGDGQPRLPPGRYLLSAQMVSLPRARESPKVPDGRRRQETQFERVTPNVPLGLLTLRDRCVGVGKEHARARSVVPLCSQLLYQKKPKIDG